ncbi:zona pellucida protein C isoform X2 [Phyllopteryx taeniolatus]|uniref:zona pellucida protein C isoform X2 n=1 Tax=Phyllopteryx taeniolatus TaxID=161469 RepID=UPI002AD25C5A|nr:zona pellucida protein C isoform X2 [Phyllopteryx taeniolatus]
MGGLEVILHAFVGHLLLVHVSEAVFFQNSLPLLYEMSDDFVWFNTIFNPWRARTPEFGIFAKLSSVMKVPAVQVYCDERELTLLVDKRTGDATFSREDIRLGDGCYSNSELPSQLMFTYGTDQCGTSHKVEKGLDVFSNSLHFSPGKVFNMRLTPSAVHVSCIPNRSKEPNLPDQTLADKSRQLSIQAMDASWTSAAESKIYMRGQIINVQVSAQIGPHQQLFIQSCFVSSSPESHAKPRHAIIMNKGCAATSGSPYMVITFLDSEYSEVKFALNSTDLISEMYIHCSVLISDIGITSASKSCNFDLVNSRWEELSGNVEVCRCCSSKCKGLSVKHHPLDAKAVVSTGPLFIVKRSAPSIPEPVLDSMQSDAAAPEEEPVIDTSVPSEYTEFQWPSPPGAVAVVRRDPISGQTLVLPARKEQGDTASDSPLNELQSPSVERQTTSLDDIEGQSANLALGRPLRTEVQNKLWRDNQIGKRQERVNDAQPIRHSKIQLSKNADGSQTLSYEEAVAAQDADAIGTHGMDEAACKRKRAGRELRSIFLHLLSSRLMAHAE